MASPREPRAVAKVGRVRSILEISTRLHHKKIHFSCEAHCHENDRLDQPLMHQLVMHYLEADPIPYASLNGIECGFTVRKHRLPGSAHQWRRNRSEDRLSPRPARWTYRRHQSAEETRTESSPPQGWSSWAREAVQRHSPGPVPAGVMVALLQAEADQVSVAAAFLREAGVQADPIE